MQEICSSNVAVSNRICSPSDLKNITSAVYPEGIQNHIKHLLTSKSAKMFCKIFHLRCFRGFRVHLSVLFVDIINLKVFVFTEIIYVIFQEKSRTHQVFTVQKSLVHVELIS